MGNGTRVLGIDVGGSSVKMGLLDPGLGLTDVSKADSVFGDASAMVDIICGLAERYSADIVGLGTAGMVNHKTGFVSASNLGWSGVPLRRTLIDRLKVPVWVDNDAQAALMAEVYNGVCVGARCAVYVTLGTGVGGALLIDGRPWRGDDNAAFELGHIMTHAEGELCACGRRGCLEAYASTSGFSRLAGGKPVREVIDGVLAGDAGDLEILRLYARELAYGIQTIVNLFRPDVVAIGGGVSVAGVALIDRIYGELAALSPRGADLDGYNIKLAAHRNNAGMIGAATLAKLHFQK